MHTFSFQISRYQLNISLVKYDPNKFAKVSPRNYVRRREPEVLQGRAFYLKMGAASKFEPSVSGPCQNFDLQQGRRKFKWGSARQDLMPPRRKIDFPIIYHNAFFRIFIHEFIVWKCPCIDSGLLSVIINI